MNIQSLINEIDNENITQKSLNNFDELRKELTHDHETLNIIHTNIRSIHKNFDNFCTSLDTNQQKFDVIILTETRNLINSKLFEIPGYNIIFIHSYLNQNDGVVLYIKNNINYTHEVAHIGNFKAIEINARFKEKVDNITALYILHQVNKDVFFDNLSK